MRSLFRPLSSAAAIAVALTGVSSVAFAEEETTFGKFRFDYYGHINIGIQSLDDGVNSDTFLTDNDNSNTRIGFNLRRELDNGDKVRFQFETALGLTGSAATTPTDNDLRITTRRTELRRFDFSYEFAQLGKISVGQGSTATDGVAENDLSGTSVVAYSSFSDLGAAVAFRTTAGAQSAVTVGSAFSNFDGARRFRIRYDAPSYRGISAAVSYGQEILRSGDTNNYSDFSLNYDKDYGDFTVNSGIGYSDRDNGTELALSSFAVRHNPTGLNATLAAGKNLNADAQYIFAKAGIVRDWFNTGSTAVSVEYYAGSDFVTVGSGSTAYGVSAVQKIDQYNLELYASYRTFEYEDTTTTYQDVDAAILGARFRF